MTGTSKRSSLAIVSTKEYRDSGRCHFEAVGIMSHLALPCSPNAESSSCPHDSYGLLVFNPSL